MNEGLGELKCRRHFVQKSRRNDYEKENMFGNSYNGGHGGCVSGRLRFVGGKGG